ncbi:MAG: FAD-dependent oxidoreductase [Trueperella sp.]|nr:FAD-dependent oxidoreductase [Trueperella sp.]
MSEYDFDVIVVGAGVAGSVAAYQLAKQGYEVLLVERGAEPGTKNLSGGVLYSAVLEKIYGAAWADAPVERPVTRNVLSFLNADSAVNLDYWDERLAGNAVTVLRAKLDPWLAEQAEEAGASVISGIKVDSLIREGDYFTGIRAAGEEMRAKVVILADGVNSFLAQGAGVRGKVPQSQLGLGIKAVIRLGEDTIRQRFQLGTAADGTAYTLVGDCTQGVAGGAFLYTNRDSVSVGVVLMLEDLQRKGLDSAEIFAHLLAHPYLAPLLADGEILEYGSHLVAEGGKAMQRDLVHNGMLIIGDAAGFTINNGFSIRGMDLAAGSALAATEAVAAALEQADYSSVKLGKYLRHLEDSFVGKDMATASKIPAFLASTPEMYGRTGELVADVLYDIYRQNTTARLPLYQLVWQSLRRNSVKLYRTAQIVVAGVRAL